MNTLIKASSLILAAGLCLPVVANAESYTVSASLLAGQKAYKDDWYSQDSIDWDDIDQQSEIGFMFDLKGENWPVAIALDYLVSGETKKEDGLSLDQGSMEIHLGARYLWDLGNGNWHTYFNTGIAFIEVERNRLVDGTRQKASENATGYWIGGGAYWDVMDNVKVGFDLRFSDAEATVFDQDIKAGGTHAGFTIGYTF